MPLGLALRFQKPGLALSLLPTGGSDVSSQPAPVPCQPACWHAPYHDGHGWTLLLKVYAGSQRSAFPL